MKKDISQRLRNVEITEKFGTFSLKLPSFSLEIETYFHYGSLLKGRDLFRSVAFNDAIEYIETFPG